MNAEFDKKLMDLREQLDSQRQQQINTVKNVLERERSRDLTEMEESHQTDMEDLRDGIVSISPSPYLQ